MSARNNRNNGRRQVGRNARGPRNSINNEARRRRRNDDEEYDEERPNLMHLLNLDEENGENEENDENFENEENNIIGRNPLTNLNYREAIQAVVRRFAYRVPCHRNLNNVQEMYRAIMQYAGDNIYSRVFLNNLFVTFGYNDYELLPDEVTTLSNAGEPRRSWDAPQFYHGLAEPPFNALLFPHPERNEEPREHPNLPDRGLEFMQIGGSWVLRERQQNNEMPFEFDINNLNDDDDDDNNNNIDPDEVENMENEEDEQSMYKSDEKNSEYIDKRGNIRTKISKNLVEEYDEPLKKKREFMRFLINMNNVENNADCPICLLNNNEDKIELECGHSIHIMCQYRSLLRGNYLCPSCKYDMREVINKMNETVEKKNNYKNFGIFKRNNFLNQKRERENDENKIKKLENEIENLKKEKGDEKDKEMDEKIEK